MAYLTKINEFMQANSGFFWDSGFSFTLENLDNPGWRLTISNDENLGQIIQLTQNWESETSWLKITADKHKFEGMCGCMALDDLLKYSLSWLNLL